jgi:hypothetical protein
MPALDGEMAVSLNTHGRRSREQRWQLGLWPEHRSWDRY